MVEIVLKTYLKGVWSHEKVTGILSCIRYSTFGMYWHAVDIDLSKYSDEELIEIRQLINQEMINRKIVKSAKLPVGRYTVGVDIPVGKYVIEMQNKNMTSGPIIKVYKDISLEDIDFSNWLHSTEETMIVDLKDGNVLETDEAIIISTYNGITFE